jgi:hypothetical protein
MRSFGRKPKSPDSIVGRSLEIAAFERNVVKGEIRSATLVKLQVAVLREGDAREN